ncbi:MAG: TonB-dependent receptor [Bacteroidota bacterium]|nr:TonB-dependent receptor [Bacteroidota bacterium]
MKLTTLLLFLNFICISASVFSQNERFTFKAEKLQLRELLDRIESKSNYKFLYRSEYVNSQFLKVDAQNLTLQELLALAFNKSDLTYKILDDKLIVITPKVTQGVMLQQKITGTVTDKNTGETLPGVSIIVKGTTTGVITDIQGKFTIEVSDPNAILMFSYVGYFSQEVKAAGQSILDLKLTPDVQKLDEVVVIGYGTVKKRDLTGSVSSVKADDIVKAPTSNVMEAIQGKIPGMDVVRSSGAAGAGVNISIRGTRTVDVLNVGANKPLVIIDGIQGGDYSDLSSNDIESVEVLKDASSTAIYGHMGAGGVIIITTKKAKAGKTKVSYNGYYGVNGLTSYPYGRMGDDYIAFRREAYKANNTYTSDQAMFTTQEWNAMQAGQWVNWDKLLLNNGSLTSHQLSVSGGTEKTQSYLSAGYFKEVGAVKDDYTRFNGRVNVDHTINNWAKAGMQTQVTHFNQNKKQDPLATANSISPLGVPYDEYGNIIVHPIAGDNSTISPLSDLRPNAAADNVLSTKIFASGYLEITPLKGLTLRSNMGVNLVNTREGIFNDSLSLARSAMGTSYANVINSNSRNIVWDNIATYTKAIGDHSFTITALTSYNKLIAETYSEDGIKQALPGQLFYNLNATQVTSRNISSNYSKMENMSYGGRINYSYKGKYLVTLSNRLDGSSVLTKKWSSFPSAAFAWRVADENFMKNINVINELKLRLSYGVAGNANINPYSTQSGIAPASNMSFGENAAPAYSYISSLANEDLGWERSTTTNIGLDLGIFKGRLSTTIDVYKTVTDNMLLAQALPVSTGGTSSKSTFTVYKNMGATENKGIEIAINSVNVETKNFRWTSAVTFSTNQEKITRLVGNTDLIAYNGKSAEENSLLIGRPVRSIYTYKKLGIWQTADSLTLKAINPKQTTKFKPGDIKLADMNGDTVINTNDRTYIGSKSPKWEMGFENKVAYKGFDLSVYCFVRWGQMISDDLLGRYNPSGSGNGPAFINYWTPSNPTNDFPRPLQGATFSSYTGYYSLYFVDGSYFKVKNVSLGYTLPARLTKKFFMEKLRVYVTASNLLTITNSHLVKNYDPENSGSEKFPMSKQFIFGVNVDF